MNHKLDLSALLVSGAAHVCLGHVWLQSDLTWTRRPLCALAFKIIATREVRQLKGQNSRRLKGHKC